MKYTIRTSKLSARGRANIQVDKRTRDEIKALAEKHGISQGVMVERLTMWCMRSRGRDDADDLGAGMKRMIEGEG